MSDRAIILVLACLGVLALSAGEVALSYWEATKEAEAEVEVQVIQRAIVKLARDTVRFPLYKDGARTAGEPEIELLRGPGEDPIDHDGLKWLTTTKVDDLENHLVKNNPGAVRYATNGRFPWQGPYLGRIDPDPWGRRYLVNIKNAHPAENPGRVVWVLSAGPNGKIETDPTALADANPAPGGDDIAVRIK
jgi:type II secretory pathway pseudopilin PulG